MIRGKFYTRTGELVFIRLIGDKAGEMARELADQADMTQQRIQSDLNSYESQPDSQRDAFREIEDQTTRIFGIVGDSKISESVRKQLLSHLNAIAIEVRNQL